MSIDRVLVLSDIHIPFHHERAIGNVLDMMDDFEWKNIVLNGDTMDCYSISSFPKRPNMPSLYDECVATERLLDDIEHAAPEARYHWLDGNHEERIYRMLKDNPGLYDLPALKLKQLLHLPTRGWTYDEYMKPRNFGEFTVVHGNKVSKHSSYSAKATLLDGGFTNVCIGHTHRQGMYKHSGVYGTRRAWELGGLWDKDKAKYLVNPNWQGGFGVAYMKGKEFIDLTVVEVNQDGRFIFEGVYY